MTYKNLVDNLESIITAHNFVETYGYGNISDIAVPDNEEPPNYPYVFLNPQNVSIGRTNFATTLNLICMTQVSDGEQNELTGQDLCIQIIQDVLSVFTNTNTDPLLDVALPVNITPFKERFQDDVVGATATLTINYGKAIDGCDTPFSSLKPIEGEPCPQALITDGDGSEHLVDAGGEYTCLPATTKVGNFYQRQIPWANNDPGVVGSTYWHIQNGTFDYTPPSNPLTISALPNDYDYLAPRLLQDNRFGNKFKYTNDVGEEYTEGFADSGLNTSPNPRICIDHFSGLAYYVEQDVVERQNRTYAQAVDYANNFSYGGFSDWRLVDIGTYLVSVRYHDYANSYPNVYAPMVDPNIRNYGGQLWTGTFSKDNWYMSINTNGGTITGTTNPSYNTPDHLMMVRNYYV